MSANVGTRHGRHILREVYMNKPCGVLVIVLAMLVTVGALAANASKSGESQPNVTHRAVKAQPRESAPQAATNHGANNATSAEIERGKYLVENVAMCVECHTPRNERGELRQDAWLAGAPVWIRPVAPIPNWADHAPALAGWPSFTEEQGERVLEKGTGPEGEELRPPMHIYHMKHEDAKAIIAYLKSLPRSSQTF
jgi:Cytochrome c